MLSNAEVLLESYFELKNKFVGNEVRVSFVYNPPMKLDYEPTDEELFYVSYKPIKRLDNPDTEEGGYYLVAEGPIGTRLFHVMKIKGNLKFFRIFGINIGY